MKDKIKNQFDKAFQKANVDVNQLKPLGKAAAVPKQAIQPKIISPPTALNKAKVIAPPQKKV